jgi:hypothetical protein
MTLSLINTEEKQIIFPEFEKKVIYDANGNPIEGFSAITNKETEQVNAVMSSRYTVFNHEEAYKIIDQAATNLCPTAKADVSFRSNDGYMKVSYLLPEEFNVEVGEGDSLQTLLVGTNSVDGSKTLSFDIFFKRLVCSNGMSSFTREFSFSRRHSKFIHEDTNNFDIAAQIDYAWKKVQENAAMLKNNAVDFDKGMSAIHAMVERKIFPKKMQTWIEEEWRKASSGTHAIAAENGSNLWTLYNSVTSAITHSTDKKGNGLSEQQKELYGNKINSMILKLAA